MLEQTAKKVGVVLDLSALEINGDPAGFEQEHAARGSAAGGDYKRFVGGTLPGRSDPSSGLRGHPARRCRQVVQDWPAVPAHAMNRHPTAAGNPQ